MQHFLSVSIHIMLIHLWPIRYTLLWNDSTSLDSNECVENNNDCDVRSVCLDTVEGFECVCPSGFSGDGRMCIGKLY